MIDGGVCLHRVDICKYGKQECSCALKCQKEIEDAFQLYLPAEDVAAIFSYGKAVDVFQRSVLKYLAGGIPDCVLDEIKGWKVVGFEAE